MALICNGLECVDQQVEKALTKLVFVDFNGGQATAQFQMQVQALFARFGCD